MIWERWEPFLPMATIGADGYCHQSLRRSVRPSVSPSVCLYVRPERTYRSNSLRISAVSPKCGGMMHSTMEQVAI